MVHWLIIFPNHLNPFFFGGRGKHGIFFGQRGKHGIILAFPRSHCYVKKGRCRVSQHQGLHQTGFSRNTGWITETRFGRAGKLSEF
jgi:hypothetical protein